jgi:hypothetical protein
MYDNGVDVAPFQTSQALPKFESYRCYRNSLNFLTKVSNAYEQFHGIGRLGRPQGVKTGRYLSERVTPEGRAHGECRALPADAPLLWRSQATLEEFCYFRLFQWVRNVAIYAAEFTAAGFDQHETHWLAALRARRGRVFLAIGRSPS